MDDSVIRSILNMTHNATAINLAIMLVFLPRSIPYTQEEIDFCYLWTSNTPYSSLVSTLT